MSSHFVNVLILLICFSNDEVFQDLIVPEPLVIISDLTKENVVH